MRTFHGGVHPAEEKHLTENSAFEIFQPKSQIIIPLGQHLGKQANPKVKKGTTVIQGELIAEADGFISAPVHSPVCGTVASIAKTDSVSGSKDSIVITPNEQIEKKLLPSLDPELLPPMKLDKELQMPELLVKEELHFLLQVSLHRRKIKSLIKYFLMAVSANHILQEIIDLCLTTGCSNIRIEINNESAWCTKRNYRN